MIRAYKGDNGKYGVEDSGAVIYEPMFPQKTAKRVAQLERSKNPPADWEETEEILLREGLDIGSL